MEIIIVLILLVVIGYYVIRSKIRSTIKNVEKTASYIEHLMEIPFNQMTETDLKALSIVDPLMYLLAITILKEEKRTKKEAIKSSQLKRRAIYMQRSINIQHSIKAEPDPFKN